MNKQGDKSSDVCRPIKFSLNGQKQRPLVMYRQKLGDGCIAKGPLRRGKRNTKAALLKTHQNAKKTCARSVDKTYGKIVL